MGGEENIILYDYIVFGLIIGLVAVSIWYENYYKKGKG
jgi:hypothetical protein